VIAKRVLTYLILKEEGVAANEESPRPASRVFDSRSGTLFEPCNAHSVLKWGGWHELELDEAATRELLAGTRRVLGPGIDEPWTLPPLPVAAPVRQKQAA
jgi:hypothetical protein